MKRIACAYSGRLFSLWPLWVVAVLMLVGPGCASTNRLDEAWWKNDGRVSTISPPYKEVRRTSVYIPMPDGVKLAADVYLPKDLPEGEKLPAILIQTRYVRGMAVRWPFKRLLRGRFDDTIRYMVRRGFAWVYVDARGSGASFGSRDCPFSPEETEDGYRVVDWIVRQPWSDGQVGAWGNSYTGGTAVLLASTKHPAVKAVMPRYAFFDLYAEAVFPGGLELTWLTDTWGRLSHALDTNQVWLFAGEIAKLAVYGIRPVKGDMEQLQDAVAEHGENGNLSQLVRGITFRDDRPAERPEIEIDSISPHTHMDAINASGAAMYFYSGWFDASAVLSEIHFYLNSTDPGKKLTIGPWDHGGYSNISPFTIIRKPRFDRDGEIWRFFAHHLKGIDTGIADEPSVHYYTMGEEVWKTSDSWPPEGLRMTPFYFAENHRLDPGPPEAEDAADRYRADYSVGTGEVNRWFSLVNPKHRPIVYPTRRWVDKKLLTYTTPPLEDDLEVTGHPRVTLYVESDAEDGAFFVYLEDVFPMGRVQYVTEGVLRAVHRELSDETPPYRSPNPYRTFRRKDARPLVPHRPAKLVFDLIPTSYLFKKGHALCIALAAADRDNFAVLPETPPELRYHRSRARPSHVLLPVMP